MAPSALKSNAPQAASRFDPPGPVSHCDQAVCQNHIVWDAVEVVDFSRKHTANVYESVAEIRGIIVSAE